MTTANPSHTRPGGTTQAWHSFRRWQRSRPFWGGLFIILAGVEMFASTRLTLNGLSFHSGATGLVSLLIPVILVTCGVLLWLSPAQRPFYSVIAAFTAIYSLIGLNLGGFFVGLLLGMVGSALSFAWTPTRPAPPTTQQADVEQADVEQADVEQADVEQADVEQADVEQADVERVGHPTVQASDESAPPELPGRSADPRVFGIALVVLGLAAAGLAIQPRAVQAAPGRPAATPCPTPSRAVTPSPSRSAAAPTPSPSPSPTRGGNVITDILDGIGDLLTGGRRSETATPSTSPTATPSTPPTGTPTTRPGSCPSPTPGKPGMPGRPGPEKPGTVEPGKPLPRIAADPDLPTVAQTPSKLTGSSVRMTGLRFEGITDLQTEKGTVKVLKFSMKEAVTADFLLSADGPQGRTQRYATDNLTVSGNVAFYCTRFVGKLAGIKITLTPELPFPDGLPVTLPIPVTFTDPVIDLAYVTSDKLTARPALELTLG
ncbi:DUF6114 domain-containing protein [Micromonospora sp. LH3U1]|uniref:DUF6114 domain-containing protein n=1 Tax=Micromonospora sp. LH3U1 TaxID=3018339 RepID=UPI00234A5049|nr:DUF6114 domain-containing protein [Micromonospora sp. LH3U1]WCN81357.1 DUF6114 domain-containing protein [Micromonospora sp. LH3U1]